MNGCFKTMKKTKKISWMHILRYIEYQKYRQFVNVAKIKTLSLANFHFLVIKKSSFYLLLRQTVHTGQFRERGRRRDNQSSSATTVNDIRARLALLFECQDSCDIPFLTLLYAFVKMLIFFIYCYEN